MDLYTNIVFGLQATLFIIIEFFRVDNVSSN